MSPTDQDPLILAKQLALPVVIFTAKDSQGKVLGMVTTIAYASLQPLIFVSTLNAASKSAEAILAAGLFNISYLQDKHRQCLEMFSLNANKDLQEAGFSLSTPANSQAPYIEDALAAFQGKVENTVPLANSRLLLFSPVLILPTTLDASQSPLIRYNRSYARLSEPIYPARDKYPV